jgi:hypothetical protein
MKQRVSEYNNYKKKKSIHIYNPFRKSPKFGITKNGMES